ncbi:MAG: hypothetical protein JO056_01490 [Alphaproteobacteria bacterium]|nr:hypothetical protein [Alphaproteobacteria bacterium]
MRGALGLALALSVFSSAKAWAAADFPAGAEAVERNLLSKLDASSQTWVKEQARVMVSSGRISEDRARSLGQGAHRIAGQDVNVLSFLLLMQAARDADADLRSTSDQSRDAWAEQDELNKLTNNRAPSTSQLSPETQTVLSQKGRVRPVMTLRPSGAAAPDAATPNADVDYSVHLDLQTAMEHEAAALEALSAAFKRISPVAP